MVVLVTIRHTGSRFIWKNLQSQTDVVLKHFDNWRETLSQLSEGDYSRRARGMEMADQFATIEIPDPLRVAAAWGNRGRFSEKLIHKTMPMWLESWQARAEFLNQYPDVIQFNFQKEQHGFTFEDLPTKSVGDPLGLVAALEAGDMDTFYSVVPKKLIDGIQGCL